MATASPISLTTQTLLRWSAHLPEGVVSESPDPSASMLVTGPMLVKMGRTRLNLYPGNHAPWGVLVDGHGRPSNQCLSTGAPDVVHQAAASITGVLESATGHDLFLASSEGVERISLASPAPPQRIIETATPLLLPATATEFWAYDITKGQVALRAHNGQAVARYPLPDFRRTTSTPQGSLCFAGGNPISWILMDTDGNRRTLKGFDYAPFQDPLLVDDQCLVLAASDGISWQNKGNPAEKIPLLSAGISAQEIPYSSGYADGAVWLHMAGKTYPFALPAEDREITGPSWVFAVDQEGTWIRNNQKYYVFASPTELKQSSSLSDAAIRDIVFPRSWTLESVLAQNKDTLLLSCSGPLGIAIIALKRS